MEVSCITATSVIDEFRDAKAGQHFFIATCYFNYGAIATEQLIHEFEYKNAYYCFASKALTLNL